MHPGTIQLVILGAAFWLPLLALTAIYFFRKLQLQQRLVEIERGANPSPDREDAPARTRRAGIVCIAAGVGVCAGDVIIVAATGDSQAWALQALGLVPIAVGIGLLIDYRLARRERERRADQAGSAR